MILRDVAAMHPSYLQELNEPLAPPITSASSSQFTQQQEAPQAAATAQQQPTHRRMHSSNGSCTGPVPGMSGPAEL